MRLVLISTLMVCLAVPVQATYYEITTDIYTPGLTLQTGDSLYMTDGGFDNLNLFGDSTATIEGTSPLLEGSGGIWYLDLFDSSYLDMSGGEVHEINPHNDATVFLTGGIIQRIKSSQNAWTYAGDPPVLVPNPHITIECLDHSYNTNTNLLTGYWLDNTSFSIHLINVQGYSPAIENIQFIPEPATISLLSLGAMLVGRKRRN